MTSARRMARSVRQALVEFGRSSCTPALFAQTGGVDQPVGIILVVKGDIHGIAGGAGVVGDDNPFFAEDWHW